MATSIIVGYRPFPGRTDLVVSILHEVYEVMQRAGLITARRPWIMRSGDGDVVAVFDMTNEYSYAASEKIREVSMLRARLMGVAERVPLSGLRESSEPYAEFETTNDYPASNANG
ncbi:MULTISPECIES: hypothetical protein [Rhodanobacteraceae]|uniref:hypothetical protein n=1 Tax=Rhodanobacteraceae TaxID=1775411 RepID=UPI00088A7574|nr:MULTISPECIES: hypothetical protein [Rhodanobacteraceae]SDF60806.1 hypothetical protein SAMN04515659_1350 [Dyella sp. 333MFSha]SKB60161.1 hypothetical protein SAMN05660880_01783 [Luteibacter sp. 22Crub2.1]